MELINLQNGSARVRDVRPKDHQGAWERCAVLGASELEPTAQEADFAVHREGVPPAGIGARRHQTDDDGPLACGLESLLNPAPNGAALGRVHEDTVLPPGLGKSVLGPGEVAGAGGILVC